MAGAVWLMLVVATGGWLWLRLPSLVNPWRIIENLDPGSLPETTIDLMLVLLPIVVLMLLTLALVVVVVAFFTCKTEHRLTRMLHSIDAES